MILPDVNLLLYAQFADFDEHAHARRWWEGLLNGAVEVALAPLVIFGFLRLATNGLVFREPLGVAAAIERVTGWLDRPQVRFLLPGPRHLDIAFQLLRPLGSAGDLTTDVQLAALAIEYQGEVHSNDADFGRFPALRWVNPLAHPPVAGRRPRRR